MCWGARLSHMSARARPLAPHSHTADRTLWPVLADERMVSVRDALGCRAASCRTAGGALRRARMAWRRARREGTITGASYDL